MVGGECLYNKMPCYFKCCVVNSEPQAPQPHCVWRWGVWKLINVQSTPRKDLEKLWGGVLLCSERNRPTILKSCFIFYIMVIIM